MPLDQWHELASGDGRRECTRVNKMIARECSDQHLLPAPWAVVHETRPSAVLTGDPLRLCDSGRWLQLVAASSMNDEAARGSYTHVLEPGTTL